MYYLDLPINLRYCKTRFIRFQNRCGESTMSSITCDHTFEDVDFLLKRNWFFDTDGIVDLLNELPWDIYYQVRDLAHTYPEPVRTVLTDHSDVPRTRYTIRDQPQEEIDKENEECNARRYARIIEHRLAFTAPPRPRQEIDDWHDEAVNNITRQREIVETAKALYIRSLGYIPPSKRKSVNYDKDPFVRDVTERLTLLENELVTLKERIASIDKTWSDLMWTDAVVKDAAKRPSFLTSAPVNECSA